MRHRKIFYKNAAVPMHRDIFTTSLCLWISLKSCLMKENDNEMEH